MKSIKNYQKIYEKATELVVRDTLEDNMIPCEFRKIFDAMTLIDHVNEFHETVAGDEILKDKIEIIEDYLSKESVLELKEFI
ncbi:hypothetical protein [Holzapfeliella sp. JNUCC 80]